ncbi:MAG: aminotransferase class V-fold PLP-dependent enzyme [Syntrophus sp. (in: bacteria)]
MKKLLISTVLILGISLPAFAGEIDMTRLNTFAKQIIADQQHAIGYPVNQNVDLQEFYRWFADSGLANVAMNNVGNPRKASPFSLNTHQFENEVIDFFAPLYGFPKDDTWGIVTYSGTDGNNHGIYFGVKYLLSKSKKKPILYVSEEAHYSVKKLGDLQNLDMRLIRTDVKGRMDIKAFEKALDPKRPALVVIAMGTTFKGGIDDQDAIDKVLRKKKPVAVYRHLDAALFGGYLPFSAHADLVNRTRHHYDSIAVSGHKFFGFDEPLGIFITTNDVLLRQNPFKVSYLNDAVPTITCSRSSLSSLKFWWKVQKTGLEGYRQQAAQILKNADYLKQQFDEIKYPAWKNDFSNTVFFHRPSQWVMEKWGLAPDEDPRLGGRLAHDIVMQHEVKETIDLFIEDIKKDMAINAKAAKP